MILNKNFEMSILRKTLAHVENTRDQYDRLMRPGLVAHPIPYFGRLSNAKVVTLGINPSSKEFTVKRNWPNPISIEDLRDRLCGYFDSQTPPPHKFFNEWSNALSQINASYNSDTVHLDLSPRATRAAGQFGSDPLLSLFLQMLREDSCIWLEAINKMQSLEIILAAGSATKKYYINEFIKSELRDKGVMLEGAWKRGVGSGKIAFHKLILPNDRQIPMFFCSTGPAAPHGRDNLNGGLVKAIQAHALEINKWRIKAM